MEMKKLLSVDGGGIRGLIPALWLDHIDAALRRQGSGAVNDCFDLLVGNSTGALVVCGIAAGKSPAEIAGLYRQAGRLIFPATIKRLASRARRLPRDGLSAPKYDARGIERVLRSVFGDLRLGQLRGRVMLLSYDTISRSPVFFKNFLPEHADIPVWQVCRASTAAPTFFPAYVTRIDGREMALIDGGVVANNPSVSAIAEALRHDPDLRAPHDLLMLSLGSGNHNQPITASQAREWGALEWAVPILGVLFDSSASANDYVARHLIGEGYFRIQAELDRDTDTLDDASPATLDKLQAKAMQVLTAQATQALVQQLLVRLKR